MLFVKKKLHILPYYFISLQKCLQNLSSNIFLPLLKKLVKELIKPENIS